MASREMDDQMGSDVRSRWPWRGCKGKHWEQRGRERGKEGGTMIGDQQERRRLYRS